MRKAQRGRSPTGQGQQAQPQRPDREPEAAGERARESQSSARMASRILGQKSEDTRPTQMWGKAALFDRREPTNPGNCLETSHRLHTETQVLRRVESQPYLGGPCRLENKAPNLDPHPPAQSLSPNFPIL